MESEMLLVYVHMNNKTIKKEKKYYLTVDKACECGFQVHGAFYRWNVTQLFFITSEDLIERGH
jgi:hypothetical protein